MEVDDDGEIVSLGGSPLEDDAIYRIGSFQDLHINYGEAPTLEEYFKKNPDGRLQPILLSVVIVDSDTEGSRYFHPLSRKLANS